MEKLTQQEQLTIINEILVEKSIEVKVLTKEKDKYYKWWLDSANEVDKLKQNIKDLQPEENTIIDYTQENKSDFLIIVDELNEMITKLLPPGSIDINEEALDVYMIIYRQFQELVEKWEDKLKAGI